MQDHPSTRRGTCKVSEGPGQCVTSKTKWRKTGGRKTGRRKGKERGKNEKEGEKEGGWEREGAEGGGKVGGGKGGKSGRTGVSPCLVKPYSRHL